MLIVGPVRFSSISETPVIFVVNRIESDEAEETTHGVE